MYQPTGAAAGLGCSVPGCDGIVGFDATHGAHIPCCHAVSGTALAGILQIQHVMKSRLSDAAENKAVCWRAYLAWFFPTLSALVKKPLLRPLSGFGAFSWSPGMLESAAKQSEPFGAVLDLLSGQLH